MTGPLIAVSMNYMKLGQFHQFHIRNRYIDALWNHELLPLPIPCLDDKEALQQYLRLTGALVIIGGLDYPPRYYQEELHPKTELADERRVVSDFLLLETALELGMPVLGICAGMQLMNIFWGGKLIQHLEPLDTHYGEKMHDIDILGGRWLSAIYPEKQIHVVSNHHQGVHPQYVGKGLTVTAQAEDGIIEALEYEAPQMVLGIQWHPERIADPAVSGPIFRLLKEQALLYLEGRKTMDTAQVSVKQK